MTRQVAEARILICDDEPLLRELMRVALVGEYAIEEAEVHRQQLMRDGWTAPAT